MGAECWELYCVEVSLAKKRNVEGLLVYQVGKDFYVAVTKESLRSDLSKPGVRS